MGQENTSRTHTGQLDDITDDNDNLNRPIEKPGIDRPTPSPSPSPSPTPPTGGTSGGNQGGSNPTGPGKTEPKSPKL